MLGEDDFLQVIPMSGYGGYILQTCIEKPSYSAEDQDCKGCQGRGRGPVEIHVLYTVTSCRGQGL